MGFAGAGGSAASPPVFVAARGRRGRLALAVDVDRRARRHHLAELDRVPVRQPDAPVARRAADRFRVVRAVQADAALVQPHPHHAHGAVRTGRQVDEIVAAHAVFEHAFVVAEIRHAGHVLDLPGAGGRGQRRRAGRDRETGEQLAVLQHVEHLFLGVDHHHARPELRAGRR